MQSSYLDLLYGGGTMLKTMNTIPTATQQQPSLSSMTFEQAMKRFLACCQLVKTWKHPAACLHAPDALITCSFVFLCKADVYSPSKHIFRALISALGQKGSGIQCSTFARRLYLEDLGSFSLSSAICHLKFHPFQPGAPEPLLAMFLRAPCLPMDAQPWGNQIK